MIYRGTLNSQKTHLHSQYCSLASLTAYSKADTLRHSKNQQRAYHSGIYPSRLGKNPSTPSPNPSHPSNSAINLADALR